MARADASIIIVGMGYRFLRLLSSVPFALRLVLSAMAVIAIVAPAPVANAATVRQAQWFLDHVHAIEAQQITRGAGVTVCVIDTGVDATHPDLQGAVLAGKGFGYGQSADARTDTDGHGTAMAGLIAARGGGVNNALGIAPASMILPVGAAPGSKFSYTDQVKYCVEQGAKVINLSGGRPNTTEASQDEKDGFAYAVLHDVVVVISMGNRGTTNAANPLAALPGVIGVSGTDENDASWSGSWTASWTALAAPAITVTTAPKAKYSSGFGQGNGTSDSAAIVSGVAALVRAKYPSLDAANVVNRLIKSATDLGAPGRDDLYGYGLVNAERALTMDIAQVSANPLGVPKISTPEAKKVYKPATTMQKVLVLGGGALGLFLFVGLLIWIITRSSRKRKGGPPSSYGGPYTTGGAGSPPGPDSWTPPPQAVTVAPLPPYPQATQYAAVSQVPQPQYAQVPSAAQPAAVTAPPPQIVQPQAQAPMPPQYPQPPMQS